MLRLCLLKASGGCWQTRHLIPSGSLFSIAKVASSVLVAFCSSLADGEALDGGLLLGETEGRGIGLLNVLRLLHTVEFNMAVAGEVWADATVRAVGATAS